MRSLPRRFTRQPETPTRVDSKYLPIGGIQPAAFGLYDSTGQSLALVGSGVTQTGSRLRFTGTGGLSRTNSTVPGCPMTLVFQGTVENATGIHCLSSLANTYDQFVRVYAYGGQIYAQTAASTANAQAIAPAGLVSGQTFTVVAVFDSPTSRRIYTRTNGNTSTAIETTDVGTTAILNIVSFGQYVGSSANYTQLGSTELAQWLGVALSASEANALLVNPWQIFTSPRRSYMPAVAGGVGVSPTTGHGIFTGYAPSVGRAVTVSGVTGHAAFSGYAPAVTGSAAWVVTPSTGHAVRTGYVAAVAATASLVISPPSGHAVRTGYVATTSQPHGVAGVSGHGTATGYTPASLRSANQTVAGIAGHGTATGYAPTISIVTTSPVITPFTGHAVRAGYLPSVVRSGAPDPFLAIIGGGIAARLKKQREDEETELEKRVAAQRRVEMSLADAMPESRRMPRNAFNALVDTVETMAKTAKRKARQRTEDDLMLMY